MEVRRIIHIDMDAFYAAVEQRDNPELVGKPVIVAGSESARGVVMTASYEARRFGIRSAMPTAQALRLCPDVIRVPARMARYREVSLAIRQVFEDFTDLIEPLSLDEAFLDVTAWCEAAGQKAGAVAVEIKRRIREAVGLTASAGVGPNKLVAKIGSDLRKPDGLVVIAPQRVVAFLRPLPIDRLWGVGPVTAARLRQLGLETLGDLADRPAQWVETTLGEAGRHFQAMAQGHDQRAVVPYRNPRSMSAENTFETDVADVGYAHQALRELADEVAARLQRKGYRTQTIVLKVRYADFTTISRSHSLQTPVCQAEALSETALSLLERTEFPRRAVRLLGIGAGNLVAGSAPLQLALFP